MTRITHRTTEIYSTEFFKDKTVLITGASGLVGSNLLLYFCQLNKRSQTPRKIFALSKSGVYSRKGGLSDLVEYINGNLLDSDMLNQLPEADIIIHCAGYAQPSLFLANPIESISLNTSVLIQLIPKVKENGVLVNLSSSEVYSGNANFPQNEGEIGTTNPNHPRSAYIESKRCGEAIINAFRQSGQRRAMSLRLSLAYGPGAKLGDKRVLSQFVESSLTDKRIILRDQGDAIRTYLYIDDAIEQIIGAILWGNDSVYNIAGMEQVTILELAQTVALITNSVIEVPNKADVVKQAAPDVVWCDSTKVNTLIGKSDFTSLRVGLENTIRWFEKQHP
jgi:UDP-glucuronate decarboxylase